jgi:hypothetical protein
MGAGALRTISASRPGPDAQRHLLPVRDIELLRKPPARRYRYSRSGALTYARRYASAAGGRPPIPPGSRLAALDRRTEPSTDALVIAVGTARRLVSPKAGFPARIGGNQP